MGDLPVTAAVSPGLSLVGLFFLLHGQSQCVDLECVFDPHLLHSFLAVFSLLSHLLDLTVHPGAHRMCPARAVLTTVIIVVPLTFAESSTEPFSFLLWWS